jgi:hypothetical protein
VLAESGRDLGFRHPLIRTALYGETPAPARAAWHRDAGHALAAADAPADRVARQMLAALDGPDGLADPVDQWMLDWLARTADLLVGQAPGVAADLLARAVASSRLARPGTAGWPAGSPTPCTAPATGQRPNGWRSSAPTSPISWWTCTGH